MEVDVEARLTSDEVKVNSKRNEGVLAHNETVDE